MTDAELIEALRRDLAEARTESDANARALADVRVERDALAAQVEVAVDEWARAYSARFIEPTFSPKSPRDVLVEAVVVIVDLHVSATQRESDANARALADVRVERDAAVAELAYVRRCLTPTSREAEVRAKAWDLYRDTGGGLGAAQNDEARRRDVKLIRACIADAEAFVAAADAHFAKGGGG